MNEPSDQPSRIGVLGAGAIGGYLGVRLSAAGLPVVLVGRQELVTQRSALFARDLQGRLFRPNPMLEVTTSPDLLAECDVVLVTVKSADTADAARQLAQVARPDAVVLSLQNGLKNMPILREALGSRVVAGMVTFNVVREDVATFRKTTSGPLLAADDARLAPLRAVLDSAGEPLGVRRDMEAVLATKLLLNLNNGLCALTGLPIAASLRNRELRWCYAMLLEEGVRVLRRAGVPLTRIGPLSPPLVAWALRLPDVLFFRAARSMMAIDPEARSSTLQDLLRGRRTEIDYLNGEIVRQAQTAGMRAPANAYVTDGVHRIESAGAPHFLLPEQVREGLERALGK